jgi:hypothetical protein
MMTKEEKKEVFLLIIESWFDDDTEQIKSDNCIGFYHYLLDCFEFEEEFHGDYDEPEIHQMISTVVCLLVNFPIFIKYGIINKEGLKKVTLDKHKNISDKDFYRLLPKLKELYNMFKDEYLI